MFSDERYVFNFDADSKQAIWDYVEYARTRNIQRKILKKVYHRDSYCTYRGSRAVWDWTHEKLGIIATGEQQMIRIRRAVRFSPNALQNSLRSVNSRELYPPEKRRHETGAITKNVATHVATPAIPGGK